MSAKRLRLDSACSCIRPANAVPSSTAETAPTQRDQHLQLLRERGRIAWQAASGYNWRALIEADVSRFKRVIGNALRSRTDRRRATEVGIAVGALNRMLNLGARSTSGPRGTRTGKGIVRPAL